MYHYQYYDRASFDQQLVSDLTKAINGEYSAVLCYERLARSAPDEEIRSLILEIRKDEMRHLQVFSQIYTALTGRQAAPQASEDCPSEYRAGLIFSFTDEQETVDFYLDVAERASDPYVKEQFKRAAADEQNHAVWFLYFLTQPAK
jgi:rubrerythrin